MPILGLAQQGGKATPNSAKPCPRFSGGNASARIDCETGTMPPPPRPCSMRNNRSDCRLPANPHSTELAVKSARQTRKKLLGRGSAKRIGGPAVSPFGWCELLSRVQGWPPVGWDYAGKLVNGSLQGSKTA
jgi:hypothetical protein